MSSSNRIQFGVYEVDLQAGELRKHGLKVKLQAQPLGVLTLLLERPGEVVTREEIQKKLWPTDVFVDFDQGLNKAINKLRDALSDTAENPRFIETIPRRGYRFIAPVTRAEPQAASTPQPGVASEAPVPTSPNRKRYFWPVLVLLFAVLTVGGFWIYRSIHPPRIQSLAVLPFVNGSSDTEIEYLGDGVTESIINNLSQLPGLRVMARSTVFHFKGKESDPRQIGRDLGVGAVLTGRVSQTGSSAVISVELLDVADGTQLWGQRYNRQLSDLVGVQEEIAREVTAGLRLKLTGQQEQQIAKRYTSDNDAYQLYLRGRYYFNKRTEEGFLKAADFFNQAIARDPGYGLAYAGLADCYGLLAWDTYPPREYMPKAKAMVEKALAIDPGMAEAHTSAAMISALYDWDWTNAEAEFRRAIELNPGYATAHHWYGIHLGAMGRFEESRRELQRALELDPLSIIVNLNNAYPDHYTRQYDRAITTYRRTIDLDPNFPWAHEDLMLAYHQLGREREAMEEGVIALRLSGNSQLASAVQRTYAVGGYRVAIKRWLDGVEEESRKHYVSPMRFAQLYAMLGDHDPAFAWLQKAYDQRCSQLAYLNTDPQYDRLRNDPRFQDLLHKLQLR